MDLMKNRKRKFTKTNLTVAKKSKKYRDTITPSPIPFGQEIKEEVVNNVSDVSAMFSSSQESTPSFTFSSAPKKKIELTSSSTQTTNIDKSVIFKSAPKNETECQTSTTQTINTTKSVGIQSVPTSKTKGIQHVEVPKKITSSTQTSLKDGKTFGNDLLHKLLQINNFEKFAEHLSNHNQTHKFLKTVQSLSTGRMSFENIAWKAALDMGYLFSCESTTKMDYDREWLEFCQVLYHMFGAGVINALRGRGHFSQVTSDKCSKGKYAPIKGEFNFPIPSITTLKKLDIGFPSQIPVGFIQQSIDLASAKAKEGAEFILSFDGKLVAPGCKGENEGDCNLWGVEGPPNLSSALRILKKCLSAAKKIEVDIDEIDVAEHYLHLQELLNISSKRIKRLRSRITGAFYLRKKLIEKCGDSEELKYKNRRKMSTLNQNTAECQSVVRRLLELNLQITSLMAALNNNGDVHISDNVRHINLTNFGNNYQLLPPELVSIFLDLDCEQNAQFIKQRTNKWFEMRKQARVTGSTLNTAIGLDTLMKQKEHHYVHIRGRKPPPTPPSLQKKFDHGTKNEINATATLISTVVPAYLPACYSFYEVGPAFVHSSKREKLLEVSADGVLRCSHGGQDCPNYHLHAERTILVEMKSPVPQENIAETLFYDVPSRYVPQIQAELRAYKCTELWLVCSTALSATVQIVYYDDALWEKLWAVAVELYEPEKPNVPTKLHKSLQDVRLSIAESKRTHTRFMCEVPTITGEYGNLTIARNVQSPYATAPMRQEIAVLKEHIADKNNKVYVEAKCAFKECHQVLREPAKELLVFMLTDKDRKQHKNVPYSYPVAYAMKGNSMSNKNLRHLVDEVRSTLLEHKIPVLCEVYDGQWHKHIVEGDNGSRLTRMYGRDIWNKYSTYSKDKCLEELNSFSIVKKSSQKIISEMCAEEIVTPEIEIAKGTCNELHVNTQKKIMQHIHSVHPKSRPDLFQKIEVIDGIDILETDYVQCEEKYVREEDGRKIKRRRKYKFQSVFANNTLQNNVVEKRLKRNKRCVGLVNKEKNLLDVVRVHVTASENEEENAENINIDNIDANLAEITLDEYLRSDRCSILQNILNELSNFNNAKWSQRTIDDLYPEILANGNCLMKEATVKELFIISQELRCATGRTWHSSNMVKSDVVNSIVKAFGGEVLLQENIPKRRKSCFNPETLIQACTNTIKGNNFPAEHLQIPLASLKIAQEREKWISMRTIPLNAIVPGDSDHSNECIEYFSYPNFNESRQQVEFRTFDFTHILTNLRTQILTRGLDYCRKEHFEQLSRDRPDILSLALVFDKTDQQNAFTAMRMFNYDVERYMRSKNFTDTANFIKLVREWHDACNRRGIPADDRVRALKKMHQFLTQGINFLCVPFQYPGRYVKGLTWQTFEALLQSISTRIQLYYFSCEHTYNARAVSTLSNESFFSDLVRYDKESHGYPKGTNVSRVFGRVVLINHFKHKREKKYFLTATIKSKYEIKLADSCFSRYMRESAFHYNGLYRDHFFDFPNVLKSQRVRRDDITTGLSALRNTDGVRRWFRTVEADILPEIRGGNKVKGFSLKKNIY